MEVSNRNDTFVNSSYDTLVNSTYARFATLFAKFGAIATVSAVLLGVTGLTSCGKNSTGNSNSSVRVVNLAPESGNLSLVVDNATTNLQSAITYKATTGYANVASGSRRIRVSNTSGVILDQTINAVAQQHQLLVVYGGASSVGGAFLNNDQTGVAAGSSRVRLINFAVGLGLYDFYLIASGVDYSTVEPTVKGTASTTFEVVAGSYQIVLTSPGTKDVVFKMPARTLDNQQYYNLALFNEGSGELPSAFWIKQNDDTTAPEFIANPVSRVRAANSQSAAAITNVSVDGVRLFTNVTFGGVSNYAKTSSGPKTITYTDTANLANTYTLTDTFVGAGDYSAFLATNPANGSISVFRIADKLLPPTAGKVRLRLVNASTAQDISLSLNFGSILTPLVPPRTASNYIETIGGTGSNITVSQGAAAISLINTTADLLVGGSYSIIISGTPPASSPLTSASPLQITIRLDK